MNEELLLTLQLGCNVQLDARQAIKLGTFIKNLQAERDALAAQLVVLKKIAYNADGARQSNSEGNYGDEKELLRHLYSGVGEYDCINTPQHHLSAHDAEVAKAAFIAGHMHRLKVFFDDEVADLNVASDKYAAQLRAKAGE